MKRQLFCFMAMAAIVFFQGSGCSSSAPLVAPNSISAMKKASGSADTAQPSAEQESMADMAPSETKASGAPAGPPPPASPQAMKSEMASSEPKKDTEAQKPQQEASLPANIKTPTETKPVPGKTLYLSADDSNSQASPVIARKFIRDGRYVPVLSVRTYEFLNYASFSYPAPSTGAAALYAHLHALENGEYTLQAVLRSADQTVPAPMAVTFLLDASGSMAGRSAALGKEFIAQFIASMKNQDRVSIVTFARKAQVVLEGHTVGTNTKETISKALEAIQMNDVTDLLEGIKEAYRLAGKTYASKFHNLVVLVSDGGVNAGELALNIIAESAKDADKQGIYLAGIGVGEGFGDSLMNAVTDKGRGAYLFLDSEKEIGKVLAPDAFPRNFNLALRNVRMKMVMPPGWNLTEFHGEQVSSKASEVTPQYLAPSDQMIFHMKVKAPGTTAESADTFEFEAEYAELRGPNEKLKKLFTVQDLLEPSSERIKGDVITEFAEALKKVKFPPEANRMENLKTFDTAVETIKNLAGNADETEIREVIDLAAMYRLTLDAGLRLESRDKNSKDPAAALGIPPETVIEAKILGDAQDKAVAVTGKLANSTDVVPLEGYKFLMLSSGIAGSLQPSSSPQVSAKTYADPSPTYHGAKRNLEPKRNVLDMHQASFKLKVPPRAVSFSFDFNFYSSEYPGFVNANYNDSFFAILKAPSTNGGAATNISFDAKGNPIEVDNNYFQAAFHPLSNAGTGFDSHGSTGWLRTSWPVKPGETITLVFSVHDEGDASYDSTVLIDNFRWNDFQAVGNTDPLN